MQLSEEYQAIGERLIRELTEFHDIAESEVRIAYLISEEKKRKNHRIVFGECRKVAPLYAWCCPYDFMITVYEPNIEAFTEQQKEILIRHELHHVGIMYSDRGEQYYIVPHDVEEFWAIIREHGLEWSDICAEG